MPVLHVSQQSWKMKGPNWTIFSFFSGGHLWLQCRIPAMLHSGRNTGPSISEEVQTFMRMFQQFHQRFWRFFGHSIRMCFIKHNVVKSNFSHENQRIWGKHTIIFINISLRYCCTWWPTFKKSYIDINIIEIYIPRLMFPPPLPIICEWSVWDTSILSVTLLDYKEDIKIKEWTVHRNTA